MIKIVSYITLWRRKHQDSYKKSKIKQRLRERANSIKSNAWKNDYKKRDKKCLFCGIKKRLEYHHTDYKKHIGVTLCFKYHRKLHNNIKLGTRGDNK